ncbi:MAG TPA: CBS domain-containing protein [Thermoanaerobaculia bacterium]|jgi:CBS domain-containing protein
MYVRDVMKKTVVTCKEKDSLKHCADLMRDWKIGMLPVVDGKEQLVGILTDRDLVVRGIAESRPPTAEAKAVMTKRLVTCRQEDELWFAEERMSAERKSRIVVVDGNRMVVGVISLSDIPLAEEGARAGELLQQISRREASPRHLRH